MQTNFFSTVVALLATTSLIAGVSSKNTATTTTGISPKQSSEIQSAWSTYWSHQNAQPAATSIASLIENDKSLPTSIKNEALTGSWTGTPTWFTALPTAVQSYYLSAYTVEASLATKIVGNGAAMPTGGVKMAGAAVAGVLGVAAML
ncbi:MAG: hypothetical protein M1827_004030 [Pycnora praestabilis]|nr:MAG: hypothetical protein M1827_004030 [Pycnora praestabilis]